MKNKNIVFNRQTINRNINDTIGGKCLNVSNYSEDEWKIICSLFNQDYNVTESISINGQEISIIQKWEYYKDERDLAIEKIKKKQIRMIGFDPYNEQECLEAVKDDSLCLQYVMNQTTEICLEAVKQNGMSLQYVREQTEEICLEAVKQNGMSLQYVREQTPEICMKAIKRYSRALAYVKDLNMILNDMEK